MPTIQFSLKDLQKLVGKTISQSELERLLEYAKAELEDFNKEEDEISVSLGDTNLPYLWSVEGLARCFRSVLGKEKGLPKLKVSKGNSRIIVDNSVSKIRPYISAFVAKGAKVDGYMIKQLVQLQEKLCESYGRKRQKVAIGIYKHEQIEFPVHYKATLPESVSFVPLEYRKPMSQQEILEDHPKGREYAWILEGEKKYPILMDAKKDVLSFPPIINSALTGKVEEGDTDLFVEATGTDLDAVNLSMNIFAYAMQQRGFQIQSVEVKYQSKKMITPHSFGETLKLNNNTVRNYLGADLKDADIKRALEKARYMVGKGKVTIPDYRKDILHEVDVIEDIAIFHGYDNIKEQPITSFTVGEALPEVRFLDDVREILLGMQIQEVMSPILNNKEILYNKMNTKDFGSVELANAMSETYSLVRSWLTPLLMDFLSKNKHVEYPQRIFEQGLVATRKGETINEYERVSVVLCEEKADFTKIKQVIESLFQLLGIEYSLSETKHDSFIEGRVGRVVVKGKQVAYIGEIHPSVLENFGIETPVAALELNLTEVLEQIKKE